MKTFEQRRWGHRTVFNFQEQALEYEISIRGNRTGGTVRYDKIPRHWKFLQRRSWKIKYIAMGFILYGCLGGAAVAAADAVADAMHTGAMIALASCGAAVGIYLADRLTNPSVAFAIIPLGAGNDVKILRDSKHEAIADEIRARRLQALRRFAMVDLTAPVAREAAKFQWLHEEGAISDREYEDARSQLATHAGTAPRLPQA